MYSEPKSTDSYLSSMDTPNERATMLLTRLQTELGRTGSSLTISGGSITLENYKGELRMLDAGSVWNVLTV